MCLAANVPLVESGTTGFNGQVQVIKKVRENKIGGIE
jgi:molybdopterin/thiamine biosynthesis adenylyltransferase